MSFVASFFGLYLMRWPYNLIRNYMAARKTGLPVVVIPIDQNDLIWMLLSVSLRPFFQVCQPSLKTSHVSMRLTFLCREFFRNLFTSD
jgi:hypothetical protein